MSDEQSELHRLREEALTLQRRLDELNRRLDQIVAKPTPSPIAPPAPKPPPPALPPVIAKPAPPPPVPPVVVPAAPKESFEVRLGTYWLPRIGIVVLLTGLVFLVTWIHPRLTPPMKIALGYVCAAALIGAGAWLEKKMTQFGRILQAGGMALAYFMTYAMHFSESLRVIESPSLALSLLAVVVAGIVLVADRRKSALLAGMALFFGYYTSVVSGVDTFTLAANAVLAFAALWFLARNRWVPISYGAVLATYLTYMIWVWKLNRWGEIDHLLWDAGYLNADAFQLRATFLSIYWLLFAAGGLIVNRDALNSTERTGLMTLNNVFFFVLFSLLMHHAHPDAQWQFQFCYGGALMLVAVLAYQRFQPERLVMDALFLQGVAVATLGIVSYFKGVQLVGALALESLFLLLLGRWMRMRWLAWIGRAAFTASAMYAWGKYDDWDAPMRYGVWFAAAVGYVCSRLENRDDAYAKRSEGMISALYFAALATGLGMSAANDEFSQSAMPWVWTLGAVVVAIVGGALRTREIVWSAHLPLIWAHCSFYITHGNDREWTLAPSLMLIAVTLAFGLILWGRRRAIPDEARATAALWPYAALATAVMVLTTFDQCPDRWIVATLMVEAVVILLAAQWLKEHVFTWTAHAPLVVAAATFFLSWVSLLSARYRFGLLPALVLIAASFAFAVIMWARAGAEDRPGEASSRLWIYGLVAVAIALATTWDHCPVRWRLAVFAAEVAVLVVAGSFASESVFVGLAIAPLAIGSFAQFFARSYTYWPRNLAWTNLLLGLALLAVTQRLLARQNAFRKLRVCITVIVTVLALVGLGKLVAGTYLTVSWAVLGFVLLALGFTVRERAWRLAGLAVLGFSLLRAVLHDMASLETPYRILSFVGLGAILLVLGFLYTKNREKIAKWL